MIPQWQCTSQKSMSSAAELQNILVNSDTEILNNLNSMKNMLKECLSLNFVPKKCKELLAENIERVIHLISVTLFMPFSIVITNIHHKLGSDRPVLASSNNIFKGLPSHPHSFAQ
jgi:hypothetical protein